MNETLSVACPKCGEPMDLYMAQLGDPTACPACTARFTPAAVMPKPEPKPTIVQRVKDAAQQSADAANERQRQADIRERARREEVARLDGHWSSRTTGREALRGAGAAVIFALFFLGGLIVAGFSGSVPGAAIGVGLVMFGCTVWIAEVIRSLEHTVKYWRVESGKPRPGAER